MVYHPVLESQTAHFAISHRKLIIRFHLQTKMAGPRVPIEDLYSHSISSDFEVADMTHLYEFSVDDMMVMEVIDSEIHLGELELQELRAAANQVQDPRTIGLALTHQSKKILIQLRYHSRWILMGIAARPRPFVPIAGEPQWTVNDFTEQNTPGYLRECDFLCCLV